MNIVLQLTSRTPDQYEMVVFDLWFKWCELNARHFEPDDPEMKPLEFQKLLAHAAINKWWRRELTKLERQFVADNVEAYSNYHHSTMRSLWHVKVTEIMRIYPRVLIKKVQKSKTQKR